MLQTGVARYHSKNSLRVLREATGTVYRSEAHITAAAGASIDNEPIECPDCGHPITAHLSSGCARTDRDGEPLPCLCKMSPDDIGEAYETDQEGTK
jgi:hypothetical protein